MRIGINALYLIPGGVGGTEIYLRNLLRALAGLKTRHEFFVFTALEAGSDAVPDDPCFHPQVQRVRATSRPLRLMWEQVVLPAEARKLSLDCLLNCGFTAPAMQACPNVTVFHDLQHKRHPENFRRLDLAAWKLFLWAAARRSSMLIADSEATKSDLVRYYSLPEDRVRVVPLGVEPEFHRIATDRGTPEPILLCASTLHPHKNLERLITAFDEFSREAPEYRLVITGLRGFHTEPIEKLVGSIASRDRVLLTGWIPREEVYSYFRRATAFFYPSTFEGFGLPVVEAMAAGLPLACSAIEPLLSITGDAALHFDPSDTPAIVAAMRRLSSDEAVRTQLKAAGSKRAQQFTWEACARGTLGAIEAAVSSTSAAGPRAGS
ncbi:MAG TPA: glycosyltransferase family 1 protein [Bryobacteraceae bacterium]|nr:glycosyltransferase family 1 protein [Bryobacteraceae bacterium]